MLRRITLKLRRHFPVKKCCDRAIFGILVMPLLLCGCPERNCASEEYGGTVVGVVPEDSANLFSMGTAVHFDEPRKIRDNRYSILVKIGEDANLGFFSTERRWPECPWVQGHWKVLSESDLAPDYLDAKLDVGYEDAVLLFYPDGEEVRVDMDIAFQLD